MTNSCLYLHIALVFVHVAGAVHLSDTYYQLGGKDAPAQVKCERGLCLDLQVFSMTMFKLIAR